MTQETKFFRYPWSLKKSIVLFLIFVLFSVELSGIFKSKHPDAGLSVAQLVNKYNYTLEEHVISTKDGYILKIHRVPHRKNESFSVQRKIPVLLLPGVINTAADYIAMGPGKSLAYLLVDEGYDVWMGNPRGSTPSRAHMTLDPDLDNEEFWEFGIDEIGLIDLPAMIDYVLEETGDSKLHYVGFSQGTTLPCMLISEYPEYNEKFRLISLMAPAVYVGNGCSPLVYIGKYLRKIVEDFWSSAGVREFLPEGGRIDRYLKVICHENSLFARLCMLHTQIILGFSDNEFDVDRLSVIYSNMPAGTSINQINQYLQYFGTKKFAKYDFGPEKNLERYGQEHPPTYNVRNIKVPILAYYGSKDWTIVKEDVQQLMDSLSESVPSKLIVQENFNHIDFLYSKNIDKFNRRLINEIKKHKGY